MFLLKWPKYQVTRGVIPVGGWSHGTLKDTFIKNGFESSFSRGEHSTNISMYTNTTDIFVIPNKAFSKRVVALGEHT